ncbi:nuclear transport factor 2 family protein [Chondromyces apiculatus]|uniref:Uncharacterized protein n=1 Tax=Chondromyces apiculatus DSM 436 TaxID=1192034 RepID=A0A017TJE9_9BACT|nr:nuclear transport factor 2 family protein [Chondromyces apiculatus]EYF08965.1 Hypothetical protein CAP_0049 [Chondromyces apiculatus DSM 436]
MVHRLTKVAAPLFLLASAALGGCSTHYIPNTDVEDSEDNRKIVAFCEKYRRAVETKNIGGLLQLASPQYYEDGGNTDAADDLDYEGLRGYLSGKFQDARSIRYEIRYRRVTMAEDVVFVDYTFSASYRIPGPKGDEWRHKVDDNRLELVPYRDDFRIIAGM